MLGEPHQRAAQFAKDYRLLAKRIESGKLGPTENQATRIEAVQEMLQCLERFLASAHP